LLEAPLRKRQRKREKTGTKMRGAYRSRSDLLLGRRRGEKVGQRDGGNREGKKKGLEREKKWERDCKGMNQLIQGKKVNEILDLGG